MPTAEYPAERVFSLVTTLAAARVPLSRAQLYTRLAEFYGTGGKVDLENESLRRKFERDKDLARDLGFPIEMVEIPDPEGEALEGYRLEAGNLPVLEVKLKARERAILAALSSAIMEDPSFPMRAELSIAVHKLLVATGGVPGEGPDSHPCRLYLDRSCGAGGDLHGGTNPAVRSRVEVAIKAVRERSVVRISYTDLGGRKTRREVHPWGLVNVRGEWRLVGHCLLRKATRVFSMDRVDSIRAVGSARARNAFEVPSDFKASALVLVPRWKYSVHDPEDVALDADLDFEWHATRLIGADPARRDASGQPVYEVGSTNTDALFEIAMRYGPRVRILSPDSLVDRVRQAIAEAGDTAGWASARSVTLAPRPSSLLSRRSPAQLALQENTRSRLGRFAFLVSYLASERVARLADLAVLMDTTEERIVEELEHLSTCGVYPSTDSALFGISVDDDEGNVYWSGGPVTEMEAPVRLEDGEAVALLMALQMVRDSASPPFDYQADGVMRAVLQGLEGGLSELITDLERRITMRGATGEEPDWEIFDEVSRAVIRKQSIDIEYFTASRGEVASRTLQPYVTLCAVGRWYVIGWCELRNEVRSFRMDRIRSAKPTGKTFGSRASFDPGKHLGWGIYPDPNPPAGERTVVAFDPAWIAASQGKTGREFLAHRSATKVTFAVPPGCHEGFLSWLLTVTSRFAIEEPADLRDALAQRKKVMLAVYGPPAPALAPATAPRLPAKARKPRKPRRKR